MTADSPENAEFETPVSKACSLVAELWAVSWEMCALCSLIVQERITFQENAHKGTMEGMVAWR